MGSLVFGIVENTFNELWTGMEPWGGFAPVSAYCAEPQVCGPLPTGVGITCADASFERSDDAGPERSAC
jgi:hypothetical protein